MGGGEWGVTVDWLLLKLGKVEVCNVVGDSGVRDIFGCGKMGLMLL